MKLIEAIKKNNQGEVFRLLTLKTDRLGKRFIDEVDAEYSGSPLYWAVALGHVHFIMPLIKAGADVNKQDKDGRMPIHIAAQEGHAPAIAALYAAGANVDTLLPNGIAPVYIAAANGHAEAITALKEAGANLDISIPDGMTLVHIVAANGHAEAVTALKLAGANVNTPNKNGETPLHIAAGQGHVATINALLEAGADASIKTSRLCGSRALDQARQGKELVHQEAVKLLEPHTPRPAINIFSISGLLSFFAIGAYYFYGLHHTQPGGGPMSICTAARIGDTVAIATLKADGQNMDIMCDGQTPVCVAAENGHVGAITALKEAKADIDMPDEDGFTPVCIAVSNGNVEVINALKAAGANMDKPCRHGLRPLYSAACDGQAAVMTALLDAGADANIKTTSGTALDCAKQGKELGHLKVVKLLEAHFQQFPNGVRPVQITGESVQNTDRMYRPMEQKSPSMLTQFHQSVVSDHKGSSNQPNIAIRNR